jgi:hypothetical protein
MGTSSSKRKNHRSHPSKPRTQLKASQPEPALDNPRTSPVIAAASTEEEEAVESKVSEFESTSLLQQAQEATASYFALLESLDASRFDVNYDKEDCRVLTTDTEHSFILWAVFELPFSAEAFADLLKHIDRRVEWDTNLKSARMLWRVNQDLLVSHQTFKGVLTVKARDFIVLTSFCTRDGALYEVTQSVQAEHIPHQSGCVRATMHLGGYHILPLGPDRCRVTSVSETDLGGALPRILVKKMSALTFPKFVKGVRQMLARTTS